MYVGGKCPCADPDGGGGLEKHKAIGFLSNTGPDPLENHLTIQLATIDPSAKRHLNGISLTGRWWPALVVF